MHDKTIPADLETSYLHLRTDSARGSGDFARITFYNKDGRSSGEIKIKFSSTAILYSFSYCRVDWSPFPTSLPVEQTNHWVIKKRGISVAIDCNGKQILDITISTVMCDDIGYDSVMIWSKESHSILFQSQYNTASDAYFVGELTLSIVHH